MIRFRRFLSVAPYRLAAPRVGVTKDNLLLVMYHPSSEDHIKYEETFPIPTGKPDTAEELGRQMLRKAKLDDVTIEAHFHSRTYPTPEGYDVHNVSYHIFF
jgi:hypothetical protein